MSDDKKKLTMEKLTSLTKRRGFVFPSSEIYGGFGAIYDYGPLGTELKNNIAKMWWKEMVQKRRDVVGLDSAIFMHPKTWEASGHTESFDDPQMECKTCNARIRVDHLLEDEFDLDVDRWPIDKVNEELARLKKEGKVIKCDKCGGTDLTEAKQFNLLVKSNLGSPTAVLSDENAVFLRGETCQGIYLNWKNVVDTMRVKIPFGIAQIGKAFRNEIVARQFVFRTREFEQMEMQFFIKPGEDKKWFDYWKKERERWYFDVLGFEKKNVRWKPHEKLAHYASAAEDVEYNFEFLGGFKELEGVHARGDWDLRRHSEFSGKKLEYLEDGAKEKFTPHIVETSVGIGRTFLAVLNEAFCEEKVGDDERVVLKFKPELAPVKVAVLPLQKKPEGLVKEAEKIWEELSEKWMCEMDVSGSIGKRYRRQDEIGTPFCVTVDFDTIGEGEDGKLKGTVTVRDRDEMKQERVKISELGKWLEEKLGC